MQGIGTPQKILDLLWALHCDKSTRVIDGEKMSLPFFNTTGVRQSCVLTPKPFCIAIDWIMNKLTPVLAIIVGVTASMILIMAYSFGERQGSCRKHEKSQQYLAESQDKKDTKVRIYKSCVMSILL